MGQLGFAVAGAMFGAPQLGWIAGAAIGGLVFPYKGRTVASSDAQILEVLGTTNTVTSPSTNLLGYRFPFPIPVTLLANQPYMVAITLTAGTATTPMRVMNISAGASTVWWMNAPGTTFPGAPQYASIGLSAGQFPTVTGTGFYGIALEGYVLNYLPSHAVTHFLAGQPPSGAVIFCHVFSRAASLPEGATLSRAVAGAAATGPSTFALLKNGTPIGAIQFAAGEAAASFAVAAAVDFAAGDIFAIAALDPQDATLADVALTLVFGLL
jgi:hypothetical protein